MSRHYQIEIDGWQSFDSAPGGQFDASALLVELDITVNAEDGAPTSATVRIWGIGLPAISQAGSLYGKSVSVSGGMAAGLPLAKPGQFGLLSHGVITQAFGEWEGVNQNITIIFAPGGSPPCSGGVNPMPPKVKLVWNWTKGMKISDAIKSALNTGYPGAKANINISKDITAQQDDTGYWPSLRDFAYHVRRLSQQLAGGRYSEINIDLTSGEFKVWDTAQGGSTIQQDDLIGFPVWIGVQTIQVKTVMRGDLRPGDTITLPQTWINSTIDGAPAGSYFDQGAAFQGSWTIQSICHVGNSRSPSGDAWVSIFECLSNSQQGNMVGQNESCSTVEGGL